MFRPWLAALRPLISGERALSDVRAVAGFHRIQASPGYDEAERWLAAEVGAMGVAIERETAPGDGVTRRLGALMPEGWWCDRATAVLLDGDARETLADWDSAPISLVQRSDPASGTFEVVDVGAGAEAADYGERDVRGAVVLASGPVMRVHALAVEERGAAGILTDTRRLVDPVRGPETDLDAVAYTSFWWSGDQPRGWGFAVSPRVAARLRARLAQGAAPRLEVEVRTRRFATGIPLLSGVLAGERPGEVVIVAHLCHPKPSANDNATGVAASLEALRALAQLRRSGGFPAAAARTVRFLWVPEVTGTFAWLGADTSRAANIVAALNLDMVGADQDAVGSTFLLEGAPCFAASFAEDLLGLIRAEAVDWVNSYSGPGYVPRTRLAEVPYCGGSDHAVFLDPAVGVPCPMLIQWPDRYYHSSLDTPDRCDPTSLALAARCAAVYAASVASADEAGVAWLVGAVGRNVRQRVLAAAGTTEPDRRVARERMRGNTVFESLRRLGLAQDDVIRAIRKQGEFIAREGLATRAAMPEGGAPSAPRWGASRPVRAHGAPLEMMRHLLPGWSDLTRQEREQWRADDDSTPGGATTLELAWYAADGQRSLAQIALMVWLENGVHDPGALERFFDWTARLGLSAQEG